MGKLRSLKNNNLSNPKKKKTEEIEDETENNLEVQVEEPIKKKGLLKKAQFKKVKKDQKSTITKFKKSDDPNKKKYESIKTNLLKQIKQSDDVGTEKKESELNFINRTNRLTNTLIKSILKDKTGKVSEDIDPKSRLSAFKASKTISKKSKDKLKKQIWHERIDLIKGQLKEKADKVKREKTVITGDMKPMIDSLEKKEKKVEFNDLVVNKTKELDNLSRKEKREKNLENQKSKVTQKQSIRSKTSKEDINLFNQLLDFSEFTRNPLDTLKKHLAK